MLLLLLRGLFRNLLRSTPAENWVWVLQRIERGVNLSGLDEG